jgi:hypothetical protein
LDENSKTGVLADASPEPVLDPVLDKYEDRIGWEADPQGYAQRYRKDTTTAPTPRTAPAESLDGKLSSDLDGTGGDTADVRARDSGAVESPSGPWGVGMTEGIAASRPARKEAKPLPTGEGFLAEALSGDGATVAGPRGETAFALASPGAAPAAQPVTRASQATTRALADAPRLRAVLITVREPMATLKAAEDSNAAAAEAATTQP